MDPILELQKRDGVARIDTLRRVGVSAYALRTARERGHLRSVCRGWVALAGADAMLVAAARRGVVLSCVTLAARKDLWVLDSAEPHVAAPPNSGHARVARGTIHWNMPTFPRDPDSCEDSLENALILVAQCQPYEAALAVWESALNKGMLDLEMLRRVPLPPAARRLAADAQPFADAGTETIFLARLRWLGIPIFPQAWVHGHRVDCLIGDRLIVQIDGGHHVGAQRTSDIRHDATLKLRGYHVIRVSYEQLFERWPEVQSLIMAAVAQRLHLAA
ncbi:DNA/RNA helicase [Microbacterium sp. CH12i]|uniref:endonuclease domain-containing protein n=1 Tax=Microbacterium sp. CH12i TaxID=1479651 RepID=UPI000461480B|nr:DUF559 domain-containing protein [Microbacterium sp. CH12i]KDA05060.1 DNA/RNA helicase [Microbacterium sp. CH12i]